MLFRINHDKPKEKIVWTHCVGSETHGGTKATRDVHEILKTNTWKEFNSSSSSNKFIRVFQVLWHLVRILTTTQPGIYFIQYPIYGSGNIFLAKFILKKFETILLIHDIERLRWGHAGSSEDYLEKATYRISTGLLGNYLQISDEKKTKMFQLESWDYLLKDNFVSPTIEKDGAILFAGNLSPSKVKWLYRKDSNRPSLLLYGNRYEEDQFNFFKDTYKGPFNPDAPLFEEVISWGLLWDGKKINSHEEIDDNYGKYETINQPHKFSLYLACGIPVIAWRKTYISAFIEKYNCGILIDSLSEITEITSKITQEEYSAIKKNAFEIGQKLRKGHYILDVLKKMGF